MVLLQYAYSVPTGYLPQYPYLQVGDILSLGPLHVIFTHCRPPAAH